MKELDFNPAITAIVRGADAVSWSENMGKDGDYVLLSAGGNPEANFPGALDMVKRHEANVWQNRRRHHRPCLFLCPNPGGRDPTCQQP